MEIHKRRIRGVHIIALSGALLFLLNMYVEFLWEQDEPIHFGRHRFNPKEKYLVNSSKCKIPNLDPWNPEARPFYRRKPFVPCSTKPPLTYLINNGTVAYLYINRSVEFLYSENWVYCCYSSLSRKKGEDPDNELRSSPCVPFEDRAHIFNSTISVNCYDAYTQANVYSNTHASILITSDVRRRIDDLKGTSKPPSVLFIGIDSISRLNFYRVMPETLNHLKENDWIEYEGYNKVGDNTFPNLMALLTGRNVSSAYEACNPKKIGTLDKCDFVWKEFEKLGYVTAYAEDEVSISTFNIKKGFVDPPTDYYFRPYMLASEKLEVRKIDGMTYCAGPLTSAERILNVAKEFTTTFRDHPTFGFFWMNSFSHDNINDCGRLDVVFEEFFKSLPKETLDSTVIIFLSDHGIRFGDIRLTRSGWLEERLPFLYFWIPRVMRKKYRNEFENFRLNSNRLTTPYDLHMTLQHLLSLSSKYTIRQSEGCPKCGSLFNVIGDERSCEDVGIALHWCTCMGYKYLNPKSVLAIEGSTFAIDELNRKLGTNNDSLNKCVEFKLNNIVSSSISEGHYDDKFFLLLIFETVPKSILEVTVSVQVADRRFKNEGTFSRLDQYKFNSGCANDLQIYCFCRWNLLLQLNFFTFWFEV